MNLRNAILVTLVVVAMSLPAAWAQDQGAPDQTGQAGTSQAPASQVSGQGSQALEENQAPAETPDARSFQSTEEFSPGHVSAMRSYFLPSLSISEMMDSNYQITPGQKQFEAISTIVGRLTFGKMSKHTNISADYFGGEAIYTHRSTPNSTMHQFGITGSYTGRRWSFTLDDRATYLPEADLGYGGFGYTGGLGLSLGGVNSSNLGELNSVFNPTGALLTGRGNRILNTSVVQVQYATSARSSISVAGSYSVLHFRSPGFTDTRSATFFTGYSHALNARDYVGINYGFSMYQIQSSVPAFHTQFVQFSYGHKISGRLAMQVGAGPMIQQFTLPISGPSTQTSWMATSSLQARAHRGNLGLIYSHFITGGAGVLRGATTDTVRATWGMPLTRKWQFSLGPGFAHNRSLPQTTSGSVESTFNSFYGNANLSRSIGRHISMFFTYDYQAQRSTTIPCISTNCEASLGRHLVGFGFNFHPRQLTFD